MRVDRDTARGFLGVFLALGIIFIIHIIRPGVSVAPDFPCNSNPGKEIIVNIDSGETGSSIAVKLASSGVVQSSTSFYRVAVGDSRSGSIAPGTHRVNQGICAKKALEQLLDRTRIANLLSINEGAWQREIASQLVAIGHSKSEVSQAFSRVSLPQGFTSVEGLLFPAQYSFDTSTPVSTILATIIARGQAEMSKVGLLKGDGKFTPAQLLTIASLVQAEGDLKDYPKISQVVRNRLSKGMPLQFDSTVHYVKGTRGSVFLSTQSTLINSPFNTYRKYGLPPTPINNPGLAAMKAALTPESGPWIFFITVSPGDTRFTDSIDQFNSWKLLYKKNLKAGKFRSSK